MSLTKFEKDMDVIQKLDDEPNDTGGLTSAALKTKFDEGGNAVKEYLNDTMTVEIDTALGGKAEKTTTVNGHALSENVTVSKADVGLSNADNTADVDKPVSVAQKAALDKKADVDAVLSKTNVTPYLPTGNYHPATKGYVDQIAGSVVLGQLPDGTVTEAKMTDDVKEKLNGPRVPTAHAATHYTGGSDPLTPLDIGCLMPRLTVTAPTGSTVTASRGSTTLTATESSGTWVFNLTDYGTWTVTATLSGDTTSGTVVVDTVKEYSLKLSYVHVYGVSWDGTATTAWSRTDDAADFVDPVPYVAGATTYGSPFDNLFPWNQMVKETRTGGVMVKIPKFWYQQEKIGSTFVLRIANAPQDGFHVCPACMDRGDGNGERDAAYIGRYHCNSSYMSATGASPVANITRSSARSSIHAKGANIWSMDYAMRRTIQMLYLVEYADWDSQTKIGYGCGNSTAVQAVGASDSMPYHTGTMQSSRTTYGVGTQYRWIEGLWDNADDWMDGCYYNSNGLNIILNPANFSDTANGICVGMPSSGYPSAFSIPTQTGLDWAVFPSAAAGSQTTFCPDNWDFNASSPCLYVGGDYGQSLVYGVFCVNYSAASRASANISCRVMELPNNAA